MTSFSTIEEILKDIKAGKMVIVVDDENRENEGDLIMAGEKITPSAINFMAKYGRGLICAPTSEQRLKELHLSQMVSRNQDSYSTAFTVSVDATEGTTTGISAFDRAKTIKVLCDPTQGKDKLASPGHIFPLEAKKGGVLTRAGHTEAAVDFTTLAKLYPVGVICEIMNDDGTMARLPELKKFAKKHKLKMCSIVDLIQYRRLTEKLVKKIETVNLPTKHGIFKLHLYESLTDKIQHIALSMGTITPKDEILVRVHSECLTGDIFGSQKCDCGEQLDLALAMIAKEKKGVLVYMRHHEGRGIGLSNKIKAYALQEKGLDTVEANEELGFKADLREYGIGAQILTDLNVKQIKLMTNNPRKIIGLEGYNLKITKRIPISIEPNKYNQHYLKTKRNKLDHFLTH